MGQYVRPHDEQTRTISKVYTSMFGINIYCIRGFSTPQSIQDTPDSLPPITYSLKI